MLQSERSRRFRVHARGTPSFPNDCSNRLALRSSFGRGARQEKKKTFFVNGLSAENFFFLYQTRDWWHHHTLRNVSGHQEVQPSAGAFPCVFFFGHSQTLAAPCLRNVPDFFSKNAQHEPHGCRCVGVPLIMELKGNAFLCVSGKRMTLRALLTRIEVKLA